MFQHDNTGYRSSRLTKLRRLECRGELLEQESRMEIEKKEKNQLEGKSVTVGTGDGKETRSHASRRRVSLLWDQTSHKMQEKKYRNDETKVSCHW